MDQALSGLVISNLNGSGAAAGSACPDPAIPSKQARPIEALRVLSIQRRTMRRAIALSSGSRE